MTSGLAVVGAAVAIGAMTSARVLASSPAASSASEPAGCSSIEAGNSCTYTFTFVTGSRQPVVADSVSLTLTGCAGCALGSPSGTTDAAGDVSTTVRTATGTATGTATLTARDSAGVTATATFTITAAAIAPARTSSPGTAAWIYAVFGLGALVVVGGAVALRRTRSVTV